MSTEPEAPPTMAEVDQAIDAYGNAVADIMTAIPEGKPLPPAAIGIAAREDLRALFARAIERGVWRSAGHLGVELDPGPIERPAVEAAAWDLASDLNRDLREENERLRAALANVMAQHPHTARCVCGSCAIARVELAPPSREGK